MLQRAGLDEGDTWLPLLPTEDERFGDFGEACCAGCCCCLGERATCDGLGERSTCDGLLASCGDCLLRSSGCTLRGFAPPSANAAGRMRVPPPGDFGALGDLI